MLYTNYYWGMHLMWWVVWLILLFWIFALPYDIPYQRQKKDSPLDVLQRRFASGEITNEEYQEKKEIIKKDLAQKTIFIQANKKHFRFIMGVLFIVT